MYELWLVNEEERGRMKAPCASCYNRREVTMYTDGKLYCERCYPKKSPDLDFDFLSDFLRM